MTTAARPSKAPVAAGVSGDVTVEATRLNSKGGSMTATLKKPLRSAFGDGAEHAVGARLDFGALGSMVLLAPAAEDGVGIGPLGRIQVTRLHERRFMVDLVDDRAETMDPMSQAFLTVIVEQFKSGKRELVPAEDAVRELDAIGSAAARTRPRSGRR